MRVFIVSDVQAEMPKKEKEPLKQCENCGKYGYQRDFLSKTGRFCSQPCVGAFAGRYGICDSCLFFFFVVDFLMLH